ncbi:hypothetical protein LTR17_026786 [Elasticomyces elasticus]|nr:hypothetical protein LTR17_026786 [Elasticomyces elasticus]
MNSYESLINHVFLPPELPQSHDGVAFDTLLDMIIQSLAAYKVLRTDQDAVLEAIICMISSMRYCHIHELVDEKKLAELLHNLPCQGGAILLYISAQNAGMVVSRPTDLESDSAIRFEAFELSPRNNAVYQEAGRLHRSFPGSAVDIDLKVFAETGLVGTIARTLAKMSHQAAPGMQPQARKAGTNMDEDRDTTHPGMISDLVMGFLSAAGRPAQVNTISKNTREEVLWHDARSSRRRSPVWMLLRVGLQLKFPHDLYKEFIVFMMSRVINDSRNQRLSGDLRYAMMAKVARRVVKLPSPGNADVVRHVQNALQDTTAALEKQWLHLQTQAPLDLSVLARLDFERDEFTALPALDVYLEAVSTRQGGQPANGFQPKSGLVVFDPLILPRLTHIDSHCDYANHNLDAFELWVAAHMGEWKRTHLSDPKACEQLHTLVKSYHELISRHYIGNPEAMSVAVLTVLQIWVALDACALNLCPLMGEYKPGLSLRIAQNLPLPRKDQMRRLSMVEAYLAHREENAALTSLKMLHDITPDSFPVKYFDQSSEHQALCTSIESEAVREKEAKIEELARLKSEYELLMSLHQRADCEYYEHVLERADQWMDHNITEQRRRHWCQRCAYKAQADKIHIDIHEWPLPFATTHRKAVIFELQPPNFFVHWRDSLIFLIVDVLGHTHNVKPDPRAKYHLAKDVHLSHRQHKTPSQRMGMLSEVKSHVITHRRNLPIVTASEFTVCLANGLSYKYYDSKLGTFVDGFVSTDRVALACTYRLPQRSIALQKFITRLPADQYGQTPNTVIASLSECPDHMSLDEYKKLGSIPCGWHLQWPNLLIQLGFPAINFKNVESTLVLLQCIYQSGPAGGDILREGHGFFGHYESAAKLLEELDVALQRIEKNWESFQALTIFISIASRLLSLSSSTTIHTACLTYLEEGRAIAFGWMYDLEEKAQQINTHEERNEYMSKRAEIALVCVDSFNVDDIPLTSILSPSGQASILLQCGIVVQESRLLLGTSKEPTVPLLLLRSRHLIHRCYHTLASDGAAIDAGISRSWTGFQPGSPWRATGSDHWLTTSTRTGIAGIILQVHFNILTGELFVNGLPLGRLPHKYEDHGIYRTLFGNSTIEVMPTATPGMDFAAKRMHSGHELDFGWSARADTATNDLLVRAYKSGKRYELIPGRLFSGIFPAAFIQDHVHWYNLDTDVVEFRPVDQPWESLCPRTWMLVHHQITTQWRLTKDAASQTLLSLTSTTSMALSRLLLPMAAATSIHITSQPSPQQGSQLQQATSQFIQREVEVEIPGLQLGFILEANSPDLESKEFPSMIFDPDQSLNTLVGLKNRLLLRHRRHGARLLLILDGDVIYDRDERRQVTVTIQKAVPGVTSTFHTFRVDTTLGRLIGHGDLQSKLFLIRLHSLATHCLPNPLIHKTGTEQALSMLRSASVRSFDYLTEKDVKLLREIATLTPIRQYYPLNERVMQTVGWSTKLGFLAQHAGFRAGVESILDQARRASIFYPGSTLKLLDLPRSNAGLTHRDSIRYAMLRVSGFGAEDFTIACDYPYRARDHRQASERFMNASTMSNFVYQDKQDLHWNMPSDVPVSLWEALATASPILGTLTSYPEMQYDAALLENSYSASIFPAWLGLYGGLCAGTNMYAFMMWLSTLACSPTNPVNTTVLQTLALCFTRRDMSRVLLPPERRKKAFRNATAPILKAVVDRLAVQWPCEVPSAASLSSVPCVSVYLDLNEIIHKVGPMFKAWYNNLQFFHYLERIGRIICAQPVIQIEVLPPRLTSPSAILSTPIRFVAQNDLFTGAGHTMPNNSAAVVDIDQLVLRKSVASSNDRLRTLVDRLEATAADSKYEKAYVNGLRDSSSALQQSQYQYTLRKCDNIQQDTALHLGVCQMQVDSVYELLARAILPQSIQQLHRAVPLWSVRQWPRVSPTLFLEQLQRSKWSALSSYWKDAIVPLEMGILGEEGISESLLRSQDFFDTCSRDLVDESDENFSVNFELIYTIGSQRPVEMSPGRWMCVHEILGLVRIFSPVTAHELRGSMELTHCLPGRFPRTRILRADAQEHLFGAVALYVCTYGFHGFPIARQSQAVRNAVFKYIFKFELTLEEIESVEHTGPGSFWTESTKEMLLLLRGLFAAGILSFVFGQKRWRVNYGLDPSRTPDTNLAVPYRAKDNPSPRSEFSHPDVIITLTTLSYYYGGLSKDDLATAFHHLTRSDQADTVYQAWVKDADNMPAAFSQLQGINLRDKHQFDAELWPCLHFGKATIDYFLANIVFPKEMKEFPHKLSASEWDTGKCKVLPTTGFSGTNDSREVLPLFVQQIDLPAQKHTNALVLDYLLLDENSVAEIPAPTDAEVLTTDAEWFLDMVMKLTPPARVILDVGAQILELSNLEVARCWLALSDASVQAVVFFDGHDELSVVNRKDRVEVFQTSSFAMQLDVCLVFLDESHTRGTDLRLPETYRAAVTVGAGLDQGQAHPSMPLWAVQGERFIRQNTLWEQAQDDDGHTSLSQQTAKAFLENEAQTLENRYCPSVDLAGPHFTSSDHADIRQIEQRCLKFQNLSFSSTALQEEQERELSPEIEQERQVQRPASARARKHRLHPDRVRFVATSVLPTGSQAWQPAFSTLSDTTAATYIDLAEMGGDSNRDLLATIDFARTIETSKSGSTAYMDAYQRPVQWILTAIRNGALAHMLVISPFEAQALYSRIHASDSVALHLYAPRCNSAFRSLDRLDFYTVPHQLAALEVPIRLVVQLNLFAGQLYINDYMAFKYLCGYLGLAAEVASEGWEIAADGFILKRGPGHIGGATSNLTKSPVKFLQTLMAVRRDGESFSKTQMGALLDGKLLRGEDFGE